jgi:hypothetical protein
MLDNKTGPNKCLACNKTIKLMPSASERARKFGGKASDYTRLFAFYTGGRCLNCKLAKDKADLSDLIKRHYTK